MSRDLIAAADAVKRLAKQHEHLVLAAEALEGIGSLEQAEREANTRLEKVRALLEKEQATLEDLRATAADEQARAHESLQSVMQSADLAATNAGVTAKRIEAEGHERATAAVQGAAEEARIIIANAHIEADEIKSKSAKARETLTYLEAKVAAGQANLDGINDRIAKAKADISRMLGQDGGA